MDWMRKEAVDVQDSGAVEVDAVEVLCDLVAGGRWISMSERVIELAIEAHLGPYLLW